MDELIERYNERIQHSIDQRAETIRAILELATAEKNVDILTMIVYFNSTEFDFTRLYYDKRKAYLESKGNLELLKDLDYQYEMILED